jgi:hypothetical protein
MYKEKIEQLVISTTDEMKLSLISDAVQNCGTFVSTVISAVAAKGIYGIGSREYEDSDWKKSEACATSVSGLRVLNRLYREQIGEELFNGIEELDPVSVTDLFIKPLADEYFTQRI